MGIVAGVTHDTFPKQSERVGTDVEVCFRYDTSHRLPGTVVRDDMEEPHLQVFRIQQGEVRRYILSTECQYRYVERGI